MVYLDNGDADLTTLDPGEVFVGGRYHSLVPIIEEKYTDAKLLAVAVVKKYSDIQTLRDVRGKKACFGGVGTLAGWVIPIDKVNVRH
jgi:melanoma-associated antigen p97